MAVSTSGNYISASMEVNPVGCVRWELAESGPVKVQTWVRCPAVTVSEAPSL